MRKNVLIILMILILFSILYSKEKKIETEVLQPVRAVTGDNDQRLFVKFYFFLTVDDNFNIYVSDNWKGNILKINNRWEFAKRIGRKGKGPGDLTHPCRIIFVNDRLIVSDDNAFNFFDKNGNYLHRFRKYLPYETFAADSKHIYAYLPRKKGGVITMYDYNGKKIMSFGKRFSYKKSEKTDFDTIHKLYRAEVIPTKKYIYLIYYAPGMIFKYEKNGKFIKKSFLKYQIDWYDKIQQGIRKLIFKKGNFKNGYKIYQKDTGITWMHLTSILFSVKYFNGKIYFLLAPKAYNYSGKTNFYGVILRYNEHTLKPEKKYIFYNIFAKEYGKNSRFSYYSYMGQFSIKKRKGKEYFFLPLGDRDNEGNYLGIYKTKDK